MGRYAANRLNECLHQDFWLDFNDLCTEIEGFFSPQTSIKWACQGLRKLKQGGSCIEDFMNKFLSLKHQGRVSNNFACVLLEQTIKSEVLHGILLTNTDISILDNFHTKVLKVGHNMEQLQILCGSAFKYSQCSSGGGAHFMAAGTQPGASSPWTLALHTKNKLSKWEIPNATTASSSAHHP